MYPRQSLTCPIEALPDLLYSAAHEVRTIEDGVPAESLLTDAIAASAAVVQRCYDVQGLDRRIMPTTVNTIAVVPSGVGKGTSFNFFFQALNENTTRAILKAHEIQKHQEEERAKTIQAPDGAILNEFSYRALMECLHGTNRNTTIQHEDGWSFLQSDIFKKFIDKLTQVWSGNPPLRHTVHGRDLIVNGGRCSFGFRIQPKLFYPTLKKTGNASFHQGLWPRAIAACYDPERFQTPFTSMPPPRSNGGMAELMVRLKDLMVEADERRARGLTDRKIVVLDVQAAAFMHELKFRMKQLRQAEYADVEEAASRAWENTLRVAAVLHVVCVGVGEISLEMVRRAWSIVEWSLTQHRLIFVEANRPLPKPPKLKTIKQPKPSNHQQRLNADMQFMLDTVSALSPHHRQGRVPMDEVILLSGYHKTRFLKSLGWLVTSRLIDLDGCNESSTLRLTPPQFIDVFPPRSNFLL